MVEVSKCNHHLKNCGISLKNTLNSENFVYKPSRLPMLKLILKKKKPKPKQQKRGDSFHKLKMFILNLLSVE